MSGRLGHIAGDRRVGHVPRNGIRLSNYVYGFGNAYCHFDPSCGTSTQTNGAAVASWVDRINGFTLQGGASPLYVSSNANFNGLPSINFNNNTKYYVLNKSISAWQTIAFIYQNNAINNANTFFSIGNNQQNISLGGSNSGQVGVGFYNNAGTGVQLSTTIEDTAAHIVVMRAGQGDAAIFVDGIKIVTGTITSAAANQLGNTSFNANCTANIGESVFYSDKKNDDDIYILMDRINLRYAIY
jgi:hypothetical protein